MMIASEIIARQFVRTITFSLRLIHSFYYVKAECIKKFARLIELEQMIQTIRHAPRNISILSICQIIGMSGITLVSLIGGFIGTEIAPTPSLATLPATLLIVGLGITTIPAAILMKKIGRKKGFVVSALIAACVSLLAASAVMQSNFYLFCLAALLLGTNSAFVQQYRFAAIESVPKDLAGKAVGTVLMAGIVSGLLGPELVKRTRDIFSLPEYSGSFVFLAVLFVVAAILLSFLKNVKFQTEVIHEKERSIKNILTQRRFLVAVLAAGSAYAVMTFIMTATPIHLHKISHYSLDHTVFVIQSHIVAMFLPSLITGSLIQKFGVFRILIAGVASLFMTVFFAVSANGVFLYWVTLVLLGIGWNFLFISSTVLLSQSYHHTERFKAQGINDFIVFICQMLASFFAGSVLFTAGWINLNLIALPVIGFAFVVFVLNRKQLALSSQKTENLKEIETI